jgi:chlorobactene glucosyltransferase
MTGSIGILLFTLYGAALCALLLAKYRKVIEFGRRPPLTEVSHEEKQPATERVTVVIAARNEEIGIRDCVESNLWQDAINLRVIVANDRSTDRTCKILDELKVKYPARLSLVTIDSLPEGLTGKSNALHEAQKLTEDEWLCFSDGDCKQISKRTISIALHEAKSRECDFLTILPTVELPTVRDKVLYPLCVLVSAIAMRYNSRLEKRKGSEPVCGAFMLIRRNCYRAIGGHEKIARIIAEDIALGRMAELGGFKVMAYESLGLYTTRMYRDMKSFWQGWGRILSTTANSMAGILRVAVLMCILTSVWIGFATSVFMAVTIGNAFTWLAAVAWSGALVAELRCLIRLHRRCKVHDWWALSFPIGATIVMALLAEASLQILGLKQTTWRGASYNRTPVAPLDLSKNPQH